ncbi:glycosyltransferase family 9 protein [Orrella sp. 11846]|uniref:glycosyltransferase family 9 protein n=1 Tax=Orrella sp. 11846 TaxID=3409913 RepID=UPI003B5A0D08
MRLIDRLAGIPLCALITPFVKLRDWWRQRRVSSDKPNRVLFIELSEMGSAILADPAMRAAIDEGAEIYFLIFKSNAQSLDLLQTVPADRILTIDAGGLVPLALDTWRCLRRIHKLKIDTVIDLELFSRFTALLTGLSGAHRRVGYHNFHGEGLWRGGMLTHKVHYNPHIHISKNFLSLIHATFSNEPEIPFSKVRIDDTLTQLAQAQVPEADQQAMRERIEQFASKQGIEFDFDKAPLILLNVNASELLVQRRWSQIQFSRLADQLLERYTDAIILLTGSPQEFDYVSQVQLLSRNSRVLNFAGQVKFNELTALYSIARVMVTNDSGPAHFASVTPLRTVVLFGPETPALYGALGGRSRAITAGLACSPCVSAANHRKTACKDNVCMQAIQVHDVFEVTQQQIEENA